MKLHFARKAAMTALLVLAASASALADGDSQQSGQQAESIPSDSTIDMNDDSGLGSEPGTVGGDMSGMTPESRKKRDKKRKGESTDQTGSAVSTDGATGTSGTSGSGTGTAQ